MNDQSWIHDMQWPDLEVPAGLEGDQEVYTLNMSDLMQMPDVNFAELARFDPEIQALMN